MEGVVTGTRAPPAFLEIFARARLDGQRVRFAYRSVRGAEPEREAEVLGLGFRGGGWVVACRCGPPGTLRAFRLERVLSAAEAGPASEGELPFDGRAFAAAWLRDPCFPPALRVAIRLRPPLAALAPALVPGLSEVAEEGTRVVHLRTSRPEAAVALVLSLGSAAELVHPPELASVARRIVERLEAAGRTRSGHRPRSDA